MKIQRNILLIALLINLLGHYIFGLETMMQRKAYEYQVERQAMQIKDRQEQIELLEIMLENQRQDASEPMKYEHEYLGTFTVTHYCPCEICCNKTDGVTFTGTKAIEGRTVAVDPNVIPLGSTVIIDGHEYIAEDIGGAIKKSQT